MPPGPEAPACPLGRPTVIRGALCGAARTAPPPSPLPVIEEAWTLHALQMGLGIASPVFSIHKPPLTPKSEVCVSAPGLWHTRPAGFGPQQSYPRFAGDANVLWCRASHLQFRGLVVMSQNIRTSLTWAISPPLDAVLTTRVRPVGVPDTTGDSRSELGPPLCHQDRSHRCTFPVRLLPLPEYLNLPCPNGYAVDQYTKVCS